MHNLHTEMPKLPFFAQAGCFGHSARFPFEQGQRQFAYILNTESEFAHHDRSRSRSAKAIHPHDAAPVANVAMPSLRHACLDRQPRMHRWRQYRIAIRLGLGLKQFPTRHGNETHRNLLLL